MKQSYFKSTKYYEGCVLVVYKDSLGYPTVGYGHLVRPSDGLKLGDRITQQVADSLFIQDYALAESDAEDIYGDLDNYPEVVKLILIDLSFNLGKTKLMKFVNTNKAFIRHDFKVAASGLEKSLWASQVGRRANDIIKELRSIQA